MTMKKKSPFNWMADPTIFFYSCSWLIVLVVAGTLAQRDLGLYLAQQKFFSSWIFMYGPVPLPGGRLTMAVIFFNLIAYLVLTASFKKSIGLYITHVGSLLLLLGGLLTAYFSTEGNMVIQEGDSSNYVSDYHLREFTIVTPSQTEDLVTAFSSGWLKTGETLKDDSFQGEIKILEFFPNSEVTRRATIDPEFKGFGSQYSIKSIPISTSHSTNMHGIIASLTGFGAEQDGKYIFFEFQNEATRIGPYRLMLRKKRTYLPFSIELLDFEKIVYPGTQTPKSYKSIVNLIENEQTRRVVIQMNEPLRHKGYTFFQSSFIESKGKDSTVLSAVKNYGRQFPYISSIIMCIGLLIYLILLVPGRKTNTQDSFSNHQPEE